VAAGSELEIVESRPIADHGSWVVRIRRPDREVTNSAYKPQFILENYTLRSGPVDVGQVNVDQ
jgi:hypothetical protein